jgi:UDP-N-acetylmuramoylalanine--D-glutamate ligase
MNFDRRRAAVLGMGASGEAAARLLHSRGANVTVFDSGKPDAQKVGALQDLGISVIAGEAAERAKADYELTILSPGIDPAVPLVQNFRRQGAAFIGELELAFRFCERPVIAITGTNGKTTTTQLIESMLNAAGYRTIACGNIGMPFAEAVQRQAEFDFFTVEVSSFQLETISTFRPDVAVWLNLSPDHLDRYPNMTEYRTAKLRIFENQKSTDHAVTNYSDDLSGIVARQITFSAYSKGGLTNYRLLPHRCEKVGEIEGVIFINDSKATNLDALAKALESQPRQVVLIAGGKDKGFEFDAIADLVHDKVKYAILIGEMADRIFQTWSKAAPCSCAKTLRAAIDRARQHSLPGDVVLFSPGTSSFDMFQNYADRGNQFREIVQELTR